MSSERKVVVTGASQGTGAGLVRACHDRNHRGVASSRSIEPGAGTDVLAIAAASASRAACPDSVRGTAAEHLFAAFKTGCRFPTGQRQIEEIIR